MFPMESARKLVTLDATAFGVGAGAAALGLNLLCTVFPT